MYLLKNDRLRGRAIVMLVAVLVSSLWVSIGEADAFECIRTGLNKHSKTTLIIDFGWQSPGQTGAEVRESGRYSTKGPDSNNCYGNGLYDQRQNFNGYSYCWHAASVGSIWFGYYEGSCKYYLNGDVDRIVNGVYYYNWLSYQITGDFNWNKSGEGVGGRFTLYSKWTQNHRRGSDFTKKCWSKGTLPKEGKIHCHGGGGL